MLRYLLPKKANTSVKSEQVRLLYHQGATIQLLGMASAGVSVAALWNVADHYLLGIWFSIMMTLYLIRLSLNARFTQVSLNDYPSIRQWGNIYILGTFLSGVVWGGLAFFFDPSWPPPYQVMLFAVYTGLIAGAFNTNSSVFIAFPAFYLPIVASLMVVMLGQQNETFYPLIVLFTIYIVLMYLSSLKFHNHLIHSLQTRFENEQLADKLVQYNEKLIELADIDELTQIHNRRALNRYLGMESNRHFINRQPLSLLFIDVDYFKQYNDTYGHEQGDRCLIQIARVLHSNARQSSDMAARYGGEEFALVLTKTEAEQAYRIAKRIQSDLENLSLPHAGSLISDKITISIGIATMVPEQSDTAGLLLCIADKALYQAKESGRNRIIQTTQEEFAAVPC